ncbi:hypothetical protein [Bacillus sp. JCM 19041]|uniref:hypothetical protein n=1 Tax=Bacillus sp. JCM 19041 TaxID=1460637 RepID=UPI000ADADEA5
MPIIFGLLTWGFLCGSLLILTAFATKRGSSNTNTKGNEQKREDPFSFLFDVDR